MAKTEMNMSELENISGGMITYTWSDERHIGTIGINGDNWLTLVDKDGYGRVYTAHKDEWTESKILNECIRLGYVKA